jgi:hypothetical protein
MFLIVFCDRANSVAVLTVKGKYMTPSVVIRYYRHAHAVSSVFSAFLIKATRITPLTENVVTRLYGFKQATICSLIIMYSETNINRASEIKYNSHVHAVVMTLQKFCDELAVAFAPCIELFLGRLDLTEMCMGHNILCSY